MLKRTTTQHLKHTLLAIVFAFLLLIFGIFRAQTRQAEYFVNLSTSNFTRTLPIEPPRAPIYDRHRTPLALTRFLFHAFISSNTVHTQKRRAIISKCLGYETLEDYNGHPAQRQRCIKKNLALDEIACLKQHDSTKYGITIQQSNTRHYPCTPTIKNIIGYTGAITKEHFVACTIDPLYLSLPLASVGISGLELLHDHTLRGQCGSTTHTVNAREEFLQHSKETPPQSGQPLLTTIHSGLQAHIAQLISHVPKAHALVIHIPSGEIFAMVTHNDDENSQTNPLTSGIFPPGSIFKIITTLAALEHSKHEVSNMQINCTGKMQVGNQAMHCWKEEGHGPTQLTSAFAKSCNIFYYQLARKIGPQPILSLAHKLGLYQKSNVDLPSEGSPILPKTEGEFTPSKPWFGGHTAQLGIGQGRIALTPIQIINMLCTILRGSFIPPHIVKKIYPQSSVVVEPELRQIIYNLLLETTEKGHTAHAAHINKDGWRSGGKTATIQIVSSPLPQKDLPYHQRCHSMFLGFLAHNSKPDFAVLVIGENEMWGAGFASVTAKKIFQHIIKLSSEGHLL